MSFFKDFKEDFSSAVNEILPGEEGMDALTEEMDSQNLENEMPDQKEMGQKMDEIHEMLQEAAASVSSQPVRQDSFQTAVETGRSFETDTMSRVTDETAVITEGMTITGNLESTGSVEVRGTVLGDVRCNGKLVVTGTISGNATSSEFFADNATVEGEIVAEGTVKVGSGSVIRGNISSTSAVIAGAVKGDIDVQGPVVVDTSAVVVGNIKSRSVQINNGAVIEGFCSQSYSEVDVQSIFG
ncbi:MAG: polymer-forming cytoskeletal protein [Lachnospiraceae bacterium]